MDLLEGFVCPNCGEEATVEQVLSGADVVTTILSIEEDGTVEYTHPEIFDYQEERYVCSECGEYIAGSELELIDFLKQHRQEG